jgi:hypothetical protein
VHGERDIPTENCGSTATQNWSNTGVLDGVTLIKTGVTNTPTGT